MSFLKTVSVIKTVLRQSSALYITGNKANKTFAVVKPFLDFDYRLENEDIRANIKAREINVNFERVENRWHMYKTLEMEKTIIEVTRIEVGKMITKLMVDEVKNKEGIQELKMKAKVLKNDFLNVRDYVYGLEEDAALAVLDLPNVLHPLTPTDSKEIVVDTFFDIPEGKSNFHLDIATDKNLINYINPMHYYLLNDAALFEVGLLNYFNRSLLESNFIPFSNPNFTRSVVVEGCGTDFEHIRNVLTVEDPNEKDNEFCRLHLTGGCSLSSFMAYFTKHVVRQTALPLNLFSEGRIYRSLHNEERSLLNLYQCTAITSFIATENSESALNSSLELIKQKVIDIYKKIGYHFRVTYVPANKLDKIESLRLSIQMYSSYTQSYVEVGHISVYDTFLSKRLLFVYNDENGTRQFPKVISGSLVNVQKLLACALENNSLSNKPLLCNLMKMHIP